MNYNFKAMTRKYYIAFRKHQCVLLHLNTRVFDNILYFKHVEKPLQPSPIIGFTHIAADNSDLLKLELWSFYTEESNYVLILKHKLFLLICFVFLTLNQFQIRIWVVKIILYNSGSGTKVKKMLANVSKIKHPPTNLTHLSWIFVNNEFLVEVPKHKYTQVKTQIQCIHTEMLSQKYRLYITHTQATPRLRYQIRHKF
ncbi:hypothetical protein QTP88_024088 [Uroleucon formosanum]